MKDMQFAKVVVFASSLMPAAMLAWDWAAGRTGADPAFYLMRGTGLCALIFLLLSLAVTPLRRITGKNYWSLFRRMLGLYAFFYACLHLLYYVVKLKGGDLGAIYEDVAKRKFIMLGMTAVLSMVPLAATSTVWAIRKMGAKRWKLLHKLVYVSAAAAAIHYGLSSKLLGTQQIAFAAVLAGLLLFRVGDWARERYALLRKKRFIGRV